MQVQVYDCTRFRCATCCTQIWFCILEGGGGGNAVYALLLGLSSVIVNSAVCVWGGGGGDACVFMYMFVYSGKHAC